MNFISFSICHNSLIGFNPCTLRFHFVKHWYDMYLYEGSLHWFSYLGAWEYPIPPLKEQDAKDHVHCIYCQAPTFKTEKMFYSSYIFISCVRLSWNLSPIMIYIKVKCRFMWTSIKLSVFTHLTTGSWMKTNIT